MAIEMRRHRPCLRVTWTVVLYTAVLIPGLLYDITTSADKVCTENQRSQGVCGKALADLVTAVCNLYGRGVNKRSADFDMLLANDETYYQQQQPTPSATASKQDDGQGRSRFDASAGGQGQQTIEFGSPTYGTIFLPKSVAMTYARSNRAPAADNGDYHTISRRGIVCECCTHRCSFGEILQYCSSPRSGSSGSADGDRSHGTPGRRSPVLSRQQLQQPPQQLPFRGPEKRGQPEESQNSLSLATASGQLQQPDDSFMANQHGNAADAAGF